MKNIMITATAESVEQAQALIDAGVQLETLNVGNMSQSDETRAITRSINVVDADVEDFNKIHEKGVKITSQMVPNDTAEDFMKLLK